MHDRHSVRDIRLSESMSQNVKKLLPHLLGLTTFLTSARNSFNSFFFNTPSRSSSSWENFHSTTCQTFY